MLAMRQPAGSPTSCRALSPPGGRSRPTLRRGSLCRHLPRFHQPPAPARQSLARQKPNSDERNAAPMPNVDHGRAPPLRDSSPLAADRGGAKRRPDARAPHRSQAAERWRGARPSMAPAKQCRRRAQKPIAPPSAANLRFGLVQHKADAIDGPSSRLDRLCLDAAVKGRLRLLDFRPMPRARYKL